MKDGKEVQKKNEEDDGKESILPDDDSRILSRNYLTSLILNYNLLVLFGIF